MEALGKRLGVPQTVIGGRRVTDDETLALTKMVFRGHLNIDFVSALREFNTLAVGLSGLDGGLVVAKRRPLVEMETEDGQGTRKVDFGHVGDVSGVDPTVLSTLTGAGYVPVVCSLASTATGGVLNVNADTIATQIAMALGAAKLFFLTDQPGLLRESQNHDSLISYTDVAELSALIKDGTIKGGMKPKISAAIGALDQGVGRVHLVNAFQPSALLLEVFTNEGCGTLIVRDKYTVEPS